MDDELNKILFWVYVAGAVVFWVAGVNLGYYTIGFVVTLVLLFAVFLYYEGVAEDKRKQELEVRKIKLANMTKEERKEFLAQEHAEQKLQKKENDLIWREAQLKEREQKLKRQAAAQQSQQSVKVPFAAKTAASAYVGYKLGKHIAKW